jgi:hypothetical protein
VRSGSAVLKSLRAWERLLPSRRSRVKVVRIRGQIGRGNESGDRRGGGRRTRKIVPKVNLTYEP